MNNILEKCYCGSPARILLNNGTPLVKCTICEAATLPCETAEEAIFTWNNFLQMYQTRVEIERSTPEIWAGSDAIVSKLLENAHAVPALDKTCQIEQSHNGDFPGIAQQIKRNTDDRDQSLKADAGKIMMELVPVTAEESIGRVMTDAVVNVGYGVDSWKDVDMQRYVGALRRHLIAFQREPLGRDEKSGLLHIEHLLCNAAFLNDRVRGEVESDG